MSQAAMRLRTSASNVKRIVTALEGELGVPLFDRESRGNFQPTSHADRLDQEMAGFMAEMDSLQQIVTSIREDGRLLKVGAQRWFFETSYFLKLFNLLRQDGRLRATFVEVESGEERTSVESGNCDVFVGLSVPGSKRLATTHLPPLQMSLGTTDPLVTVENFSELAKVTPWGLHAPELRASVREWLQNIELAGGGIGRSITTAQLRDWIADPETSTLKAVISAAPAPTDTANPITWAPLPAFPAIPVRATFLIQHPYGCIENALQKAGSLMKDHERAL